MQTDLPVPHSECTVLFVDDDRAMVSSTTQWLMLCGARVQSFADPGALLRLIRPHQPVVVVSDIRMPEMDGVDLMRHIMLRDSGIPVILITGHGDVPLAVEAMKAGAYQFLTKPFSPEKLLDVVCAAQADRMRFLQGDNNNPVSSTAQTTPGTRFNDGSMKSLSGQVEDFEKGRIEAALKKHRGKIQSVLDELDLPRRTLNAKMRKYGISRK